MAILRSNFPASTYFKAYDLRHELSRLHTVCERTTPANSKAIETYLNGIVEGLTILTGTAPTVGSTAAILTGGTVVEATVVTAIDGISDGSFDIVLDGVLQSVTGLDFTAPVLDATGILAVINAVLTGATASFSTDKFIVTSASTGTGATISEVYPSAAGTFIGDILGLTANQGASWVQGNTEAAASVSNLFPVYPEFRDFRRMYEIAVDFANSHSTTGTAAILASIAAQIQFTLEDLGWTYA